MMYLPTFWRNDVFFCILARKNENRNTGAKTTKTCLFFLVQVRKLERIKPFTF